ncbi:recombination mediator RecR [Psychrobacter sp. HD31]|uniref:recombination mediator RecR n=1 Tax=Psychrobacter sp. HD31 TaxID=3112003 RepID=UPI003DA23215
MLTPKFDNLVKQLRVLPGVGQKSAQRMALHLLTQKRVQGMALAGALDEAMREIIECERCHSFSDEAICPICQDPRREDNLLCVVETAADVMAIEQSGGYRGRYFVLGGHLSPIDGIGVDELNIDQLISRLKAEQIDELILATGTTVEGQTTAQFISQAAANHVVKITRLAQGVPVGGELEYLDSMTLNQAMSNRAKL